MIGDKLVITDYHRRAAARIRDQLGHLLGRKRVAVSVAGESGSGKSETAHCLAELVGGSGLRFIVLGQDDYFRLPPKTNHQKRLEDIGWVGPEEVRLSLLDNHVTELKKKGEPVIKPLAYFEEDRIGEEQLRPGPYDLIVVEGTYTSLLDSLDLRAFIDRTYLQTKKNRLIRGRDPAVDFLEKVLAIEHRIISSHKSRADVVIPPPEEEASETGGSGQAA